MPKTIISAKKPHPQSYGPHIKLTNYTDAELVKLTKEDIAYYAAHPITLRASRGFDFYSTSSSKTEKTIVRAIAMFDALNITDERESAGLSNVF